MKSTSLYLAILWLASGMSVALAEPVVTGISGSLQDESLVVITGANFGNPSDPTPFFFDQVDSVWINGAKSTPYDGVADDALVPVGGANPWRDQEGHVHIERTGPFRGNRNSMYEGRFTGKDAWIGDPNGIPGPSEGRTRSLYVSWYIKPNFNPTAADNGASGSHKFIRVWDTSGSSPNTRISWTQMHLVYNGGGPSWKPFNGTVNGWNRMELYVSLDDRVIRASVNGVAVHDINNFSEPASNGLVPRLLGFDGSGDARWNGALLKMTDYYVTSSKARIEIKSTPTWTGTSHGELQIPVDWNNNRIEVRFNKGAINNPESAYLYVIDELGNVNADGYPLCETDCPSPPQSPDPF